jgi:O-antigen/teichoic acid export membrane protein
LEGYGVKAPLLIWASRLSPFTRLVTGTALISSVNVLRLIVQFLSLPLLARFLEPADYGIVGMAMPIILLVMLFADSGLASSLVRDKSDEEDAWHSCFWLTTILGTGLAFVLAGLSPLMSAWLGEPALTAVVTTLACVIVLQSMTLIPGAALQRQGLFGRIAAAEIVALIAGASCALLAAANGMGVWALVWQQVILYGIRLVLTLLWSPYRPKLRFEFQAARDHVLFGWKLLAANLVGLGGRSIESTAIGKVRGADDLGIYGMAFQFLRLPFMIVTGPLQYVLYPIVAGAHGDKAKLRSQVLLASKILAMILLAPMALAGAASVPIFDVVLSEKWREAAYVFTLVVPAAIIQPVIGILGTFVLAVGRPEVQLRLTLQSTLLWMACFFSSVWFGLSAIAVAYSLSTLAFTAWYLTVALPLLNCSVFDYIRATGVHAVIAVAAFITYRTIAASWQIGDLALIGLAAMLAVICTLVSILLEFQSLRTAYRMLRGNAAATEGRGDSEATP